MTTATAGENTAGDTSSKDNSLRAKVSCDSRNESSMMLMGMDSEVLSGENVKVMSIIS